MKRGKRKGARCSPLTNSSFESESRKEHIRHKLAAMNEEVKGGYKGVDKKVSTHMGHCLCMRMTNSFASPKPSSDARIDWGANAKAANLRATPSRRCSSTTNTGESQAISSASSSGELKGTPCVMYRLSR